MLESARRICVALLIIATAGMSTGCNTAQLRDERDALWSQNRELQAELDQTRSSLDAADAEQRILAEEIDQIRRGGTAATPPALTVAANTPFSHIEGVEAVQSAGRITVRVPGDVLFSSGKVNLKSSSKKTLDQIAGVITREYPSNTIRVEGYTDTDPIRKSKWKDNLELSLQRAAAVHRYIQSRGIDGERLEAVGLGQWHPATSKAKSRRVEIVVVMN